MIRFVRGDIFESGAEALVNPVNCVGVCGKGLALEFKRRYPSNFQEYQSKCRQSMQTGSMFVTMDIEGYIINFPTKTHWLSKSNLGSLRAGLIDLRRVIDNLKLQSVAIPALGCGCGGLKWDDVKPEIEKALVGLDADIMVYEPTENP